MTDDINELNAELKRNQFTIHEMAAHIAELKANADFNGRRAANQAIQLRALNEAITRRNYTIAALRTRLADALAALDYERGINSDLSDADLLGEINLDDPAGVDEEWPMNLAVNS